MSDTYEPAKCANCQHESGKISWPPVGSTVKCSHCGHEEIAKSLVNFEDIMLEFGGNSKISMGENVGWITGPHDAVKAVQKLIIDGEDYRKDIASLGAGLRSITLECAKLIEENDELRNQLGKANKKLSGDFNIAVDEQEKNRKIGRDNWKLKQLFIDLTFCYLNPEMSKTLYADTNKDFKEIVGDDPEFTDNTESGS